MRLRPVPIAATLAGLAWLATGALASAGAAQSSVPVSRCPTTYGVTRPPAKLPARLAVNAGAAATKDLSAYSNGALVVLGPSGWHCHALIGADGSADMVITSGSTSHVGQPAITESFADTSGTAAALACSLFSAARQQLNGLRCYVHRPARELVAPLRAHAVSFQDPPHLRGDGDPSGGSDEARGLMVFVAGNKSFNGYAFTATCTLTATQSAVCATVLADALTRIPVNE